MHDSDILVHMHWNMCERIPFQHSWWNNELQTDVLVDMYVGSFIRVAYNIDHTLVTKH